MLLSFSQTSDPIGNEAVDEDRPDVDDMKVVSLGSSGLVKAREVSRRRLEDAGML